MDGTVDVTIPVDPRAAGELRDAKTRDAIGRLVSRVPQRQRRETVARPFAAIDRRGADAETKRLTDSIPKRSWRPITPALEIPNLNPNRILTKVKFCN